MGNNSCLLHTSFSLISPIFKDIPFCMLGILPVVLFRGPETSLYLTSFPPTINVSGRDSQ